MICVFSLIMDLAASKSHRNDIIGLHGKTLESVEFDVEILKEWMKKQPHLPEELLQDNFLEIHLIKNKFSVEKVKSKIESYCSMKGLKRLEYLFGDKICIPSKEPQFYIPLPQLTDDFHRIIVSKIWDQETWDIKRDFANGLAVREFWSRFDYNNGEIILFDLTDCSVHLLSKLRINVLSDFLEIVFKAHSARVKEVHIIGKFASNIFSLTKTFLPSKIASRVSVHDSAEFIADILPKNCLPRDYGGELKSLNEYRDDLDQLYADHEEDLIRYLGTRAREDLRQGGNIMNEMQGTFKKLEVD
ncbi:hypothetical protein WA026_021791 [Henosepilachna vigintioctopunctata]|uniref:CRAL-TRIO domain-containing protein n=1 Tax=Henosepilachna vigintioctopunctata TaxID=420089 RepID=A0AAW1TYV8_9CUCU